jgi:dienelactone hydrolase
MKARTLTEELPTMHTRREFMQWLAASLCVPPLALAEAQAAEPGLAAAASGSDVGSLYPFIESQAIRGSFPLSFLNRKFRSLSAWKRRARARLLGLLDYAPPKCPHRPEVVERKDCGDYFRERLYFNTTPDLRVPAYVLIPRNVKLPAPGVVALHDHGAFYLWGKEKLVELEDEHVALTRFKRQYYDGNSIASVLARQGYVVIVIDMFYWGERRMLLDNDPADWRERPKDIPAERIAAFNQRASQSEQLVGRTIYAAGFTWPGVMFWDDIRTVDYLASRPEVDPKRLGCVGLSVGGLRSCHLAALDERIKAAVIIGWMTSFPFQLKRHVVNAIGFTKLVPGLYRQLDYPDVAALAMPAALLVINGRKDTLFAPDGVQAAFDKLTACYRKAGAPEKLCLRLYDTPHEFNAQMQTEAWAWLKRWV